MSGCQRVDQERLSFGFGNRLHATPYAAAPAETRLTPDHELLMGRFQGRAHTAEPDGSPPAKAVRRSWLALLAALPLAGCSTTAHAWQCPQHAGFRCSRVSGAMHLALSHGHVHAGNSQAAEMPKLQTWKPGGVLPPEKTDARWALPSGAIDILSYAPRPF